MSDEISELTKTLEAADPQALAALLVRAVQKINEAKNERDEFAQGFIEKTNQLRNIEGALVDAGTYCDGTTDIINGINRLVDSIIVAQGKVGFAIVRNQNAMTILRNIYHSDAATVLSASIMNSMHQFMHEDEAFVEYLRKNISTLETGTPNVS